MEIIGITFLYPEAVFSVIGIAMAVSIFSSLVHKKMVDRKKMDEIRKRIETHQKDLLAAQKADDKKKIKQLESQQTEVMGLLKKNFMMSMKPMFVTMPVLLVLLWLMRNTFDPMGALLDLPVSIPFLSYEIPDMGVTNGMNWFGIYIIFAIGTSLIIELIVRKVLHK